MDVVRTQKPTSWTTLLDQIKYFIKNPDELSTLVIDTVDWAERLCMEHICATRGIKSIEDANYGKGYVYLAEEFGKLLTLLDELRGKGVHIVLVAHAIMRKFEQPNELGSYDRWELKLQKKTAPLVKEWVDALFFINYKTIVINVDGQGAEKGRNKAQGGQRVIYTAHQPCWDAKNRFGLPEELPLDFAKIAHLFDMPVEKKEAAPAEKAAKPKDQKPPAEEPTAPPPAEPSPPQPDPKTEGSPEEEIKAIPMELMELMAANDVKLYELKFAVEDRGYYPRGTPFTVYEPNFVKGALIGAWPQVLELILNNREEAPF